MNADEINRIVDEQIAAIPDADRRARVGACRVDPERHFRHWRYCPALMECWTVARDDGRSVALVYTEGGFNERWGAVEKESADLGTGNAWFEALDDAYTAAFGDGPSVPGNR